MPLKCVQIYLKLVIGTSTGSVTEGSVTEGSVTEGSVTEDSVTEDSVTTGAVSAGSVTVDPVIEPVELNSFKWFSFRRSPVVEPVETGVLQDIFGIPAPAPRSGQGCPDRRLRLIYVMDDEFEDGNHQRNQHNQVNQRFRQWYDFERKVISCLNINFLRYKLEQI